MSDFVLAHAAGSSAQVLAAACSDQLRGAKGHAFGFVYATSPLSLAFPEIINILQNQTGIQNWVGTVGHGVCAGFYFLALTASSPWMFVLYIGLAAFWNDITMGSAWASCIDIGGRYSGIVSGCMNMIGNLGGAIAGTATGWVLDLYGKETGWTINFVSFGMVYVAAMFFWLRFDATKKLPQSA